MSKLQIVFTVPIQGKDMPQRHLKAINEYIKYNSKLNSDNNIISSQFGIIVLIEKTITNNNNILTFDLIVETEKQCSESVEDAEDIIWAVLPAAYSADESYIFMFSIDYLFSSKSYVLHFEDTPNFQTIKLL
jgi:hypothetical protein